MNSEMMSTPATGTSASPATPARDWAPFLIGPSGTRPEAPRSIQTLQGVGDRLRAAAFADIQARDAFLWAAETFEDASLWISLTSCKSARDFALYMASAEERGRRAGERFHTELQTRDPETAQIFGKIAEEEIAHIEIARRFFSDASPTSPA
jgi:hypothetical protein